MWEDKDLRDFRQGDIKERAELYQMNFEKSSQPLFNKLVAEVSWWLQVVNIMYQI